MACSAHALNPLEASGSKTSSPSRKSDIQSLALAGLLNPANLPQIGAALAPSKYKTFLVGHIAVARPSASGVVISLDSRGAATLASWTSQHLDQPVVVLFGGRVVSVPFVKEPLRSGNFFVSIDASSSLGHELFQAAADSQSAGQ